jgi:hypothetical protein
MNADMSARAVTIRLKRTAQLRNLCLSLGKAKILPPKPAEAPKKP